MKEILIKRKSSEELNKAVDDINSDRANDICADNIIDVYLDGEKITNLKSFSITITSDCAEPVYTVERYMDARDFE